MPEELDSCRKRCSEASAQNRIEVTPDARARTPRVLALALRLGLVLVLANTGCLSSSLFDGNTLLNQDLQASDHDRIFPTVRVSWEVSEDERDRQVGLLETLRSARPAAKPAEGEARATLPEDPVEARERRAVRGAVSFDAEYAVGIGGRDDRPTPGNVEYADQFLVGVPSLRYDYDLHIATLGARGGLRIADYFALEALGGLSLSSLRLQLEDATQQVTDTGTSLGGHIGARITIRPHPVFGIVGEGKINLMGGLHDKRRFVFVPTAMVAGELHFTRNVSAFGGYRWWRYRENIASASDIDDLVIEGPTFGVLMRF